MAEQARNRATRFTFVSVPHTGTRFLRKFFRLVLKAEYVNNFRDIYETRYFEGAPRFAHYHPVPGYNKEFVERTKYMPTLTTLRHPHMQFITTCFYMMDSRGLESAKAYSLSCWDNMMREWPKYNNTMAIPVDWHLTKCERENYLKKIPAFVGIEEYNNRLLGDYAATWHPEGTKGSYPLKEKFLLTGEAPCSLRFLDPAVDWYYEQLKLNGIDPAQM